jgi:hypothetical protein
MDEGLKEYRKHLVESEYKAIEAFDKSVLTLSSGAFGITVLFLKEIVGDDPVVARWAIIWAWSCWVASIACTLLSFWSSQRAFRRAIIDVDSGRVYDGRPGAVWDHVTAALNTFSGVLFLVGLVFVILFVSNNLR